MNLRRFLLFPHRCRRFPYWRHKWSNTKVFEAYCLRCGTRLVTPFISPPIRDTVYGDVQLRTYKNVQYPKKEKK